MTIQVPAVIKVIGRVLTNQQIIDFLRKDCEAVQIFWNNGLVVYFPKRETEPSSDKSEDVGGDNVGAKDDLILQLQKIVPDAPLFIDEETRQHQIYLKIPREEKTDG